MIEFRKAQDHEAARLSDLAITSKAYWGYSPEQIELWREGLTISAAKILEDTVRTVWTDDKLCGFFSIRDGDEPELDHLWLLPECIGKGLGGETFKEIRKECRRLGIHELSIVSDPHAEGFYLKQGARRIGKVESIPQNRFLPKLSYVIQPQQ